MSGVLHAQRAGAGAGELGAGGDAAQSEALQAFQAVEALHAVNAALAQARVCWNILLHREDT